MLEHNHQMLGYLANQIIGRVDRQIDRSTFEYWITGNGYHLTRWDCTSHDTWLYIANIVSNGWMSFEYGKYAYYCHKAFKILESSHAKTHMSRLRIVFLQYMTIHLFMSVFSWFCSIYWFTVLLVLFNAYTTRKMNESKIMVLHIQEIAKDQHQKEDALHTLDDANLTLEQKLDKAKRLLLERIQ